MTASPTDVKVIYWSLTDTYSSEWQYTLEVFYVPWAYRVGALFSGMLSLFSFLGVICSMQGVPSSASVYYLAVHSTKVVAPGGVCAFVLVTLGEKSLIVCAVFVCVFGCVQYVVYVPYIKE